MPHVCGDEPHPHYSLRWLWFVCPTYVGMNRTRPNGHLSGEGMPHVCGDEPAWSLSRRKYFRMPHVCGDEPLITFVVIVLIMYAPRMWG